MASCSAAYGRSGQAFLNFFVTGALRTRPEGVILNCGVLLLTCSMRSGLAGQSVMSGIAPNKSEQAEGES